MTTIKLINMKNVTFIIWIFVVLCAGCGSSTSVYGAQNETYIED